ncbi:CU044_5270 family protein [Nonomuraea aurantiaca]|uniref:CU044_5270 family protein n=1 Tax=Nonomuraea aurantiaca TaxID=2878562 RepID=UPI001CD9F100|nr:CU044_5270 family protein [Nonomuraea aurantiaca]MCA2224411.1 CU044_5270 family protein [Nonomuraea aurantiaca]
MGEPERFSAIFDRYYPEIHGYAAHRLDSALADDIAAETFLIAFDKRTGFDLARPDARPWLYGIASNLIARHRRAEVRRYRALAKAGSENPMEDHADRVAGAVDAVARKSRLAQALAEIAALMARAARPSPKRRWAMRALAVAASAVVIATGATVFQSVGGGEPTLPAANAQVVLTRIAATVQKKDFTPPRDDQWIYTESRMRIQDASSTGKRLTPRTPLTNTIEEFWTRADGRRVGYKVGGKLITTKPRKRTPENTYAMLATLPTDPDKLLARFRKINTMRAGDQDGWIFQRLGVTLSQNIAPPAQESAIFKAMAKLPGVTVNESAVDDEGRPTLSVSRVSDGWLKREVLLDPSTYAFRGARETAVADHEELNQQPGVKTFTVKDGKFVPDPLRVEWSIEKGTVWQVYTRTVMGVVDRLGQKP